MKVGSPRVTIDTDNARVPTAAPSAATTTTTTVGAVGPTPAAIKAAGVGDDFGTRAHPFEGDRAVEALQRLRDAGKPGDVRQVAATNLKAVMDALIEAHQPKPGTPRNHWIGDIEGRSNNGLTTLIDAGVIRMSADGRDATLPDKTSRIVFLGDIGDRGAESIFARRVLTTLKQKYPDRVDILWGNRCLSKLGLHNDLPRLEKLEDKDYRAWLGKKEGLPDDRTALQAKNTIANRVEYWLQAHGAGAGLANHHRELVEIQQGLAAERGDGAAITLDQAAQSYVDALKPGGEFFEFLKLGNWGTTPAEVRGPVVAWHGGASSTSIRQVPGDDRPVQDATDWMNRWQAMGQSLIEKVEQQLTRSGTVPLEILSLGDSDYDDRAGVNSFKAFSNTYGARDKEDGNYRGANQTVARFYEQSGVFFEMVGHSPIGNLPTPFKSAADGGVVRVYNDTSFSNDGSTAMVASVGDLVVMAGRVGDEKTGEIVFWTLKPGDASPIGMVTEDGYAVRGVTLDGRYSLCRYVNGHDIDAKTVTPDELRALKPNAVALEETEEAHNGRDAWFRSLEDFEIPVLTPHTLESTIGNRMPIVISGASEYGDLPVSPAEMQALWRSLERSKGNEDRVFLTGGTNVSKSLADGSGTAPAPEFMFHEAFQNKHSVVGFVPEQTNTSQLADVSLFVTGKKGEWDAPLQSSMAVAGEKSGAAIFIGGGGTIGKAIARARDNPQLGVFLVVKGDVAERAARHARGEEVRTYGASDRAAVELLAAGRLPANFRLVKPGDDLGALVDAHAKTTAAAAVGERGKGAGPRRVGVFLGSFNPPHAGHRAMLERHMKEHQLDAVYVVPDRVTSYKKLAPLDVRDEMTRALFADVPGVRTLTPQITKELKSGEMWDVMEAVRQAHPGASLFNIMGSDTLQWWQTLPEATRGGDMTLLVNVRKGDDAGLPAAVGGQTVKALVGVDEGLSSTQLREQMTTGRKPAALPDAVWNLIVRRGLYGVAAPARSNEREARTGGRARAGDSRAARGFPPG